MAKDAADIAPKFVPEDKLIARDDSGGPGYKATHGDWDDSGRIVGGAKGHLSPGGKG